MSSSFLRSDANIVSGQNLKNKKSSVVYSYSHSKASPKSDSDSTQQIQERFNPRPYFDYDKPPKKSSNGGDSTKSKTTGADDSNPSVVYGSPFASFPVFTKAQVSNPDDSDNLYDSPYSSYNPPEKPKEDKDQTMYNFPPLGPPATGDSSNDDYPGPPDDGGDDNSKPPKDSYGAPPSNAYLPPPSPPSPPDMQSNDDYPSSDDKPSAMSDSPKMPKYPGPYSHLPAYDGDSDSYGPPAADNMSKPPSTAYGPKPPTAYGPPDHDMDAPDSYGPPAGDHMPKPPSMAYGPKPPTAYGPSDHDMDAPGPPITQTIEPHHGYYDAKHNYYDHPVGPPAPPPPATDDDMAPPNGAHGPPGFGQVPQYLDHDPKGHGYDFYGYDHHPVYHEVTTTEAPEDMRVNKGQYSYYYLGRKLWYIPLYFSIYFIIYVTVLILKSIARHKVDFKQSLNDLHNKYRKSRNMEINDVRRNVERAIETSSRKYEFM